MPILEIECGPKERRRLAEGMRPFLNELYQRRNQIPYERDECRQMVKEIAEKHQLDSEVDYLIGCGSSHLWIHSEHFIRNGSIKRVAVITGLS